MQTKKLSELFEDMANAKVLLGAAEEWLDICPVEDRKQAYREYQEALENHKLAKEELNIRLVQLGRQPLTNDRPAKLVNF